MIGSRIIAAIWPGFWWNRNSTLWGGYIVRGPEGTVYHSGDTAWGDHFAEIGQRAGPIDLAMLPIGGYAPRWFMESQHVDPEEAKHRAASEPEAHSRCQHKQRSQQDYPGDGPG